MVEAKYKVRIQGVTGMLQNKLSKDLADEIKAVPKGKKEEWEEENWRRKLYTGIGPDGKETIILPFMCLHAMCIEACKKHRIPPPTAIGRTWTNYVTSSLMIEGDGLVEKARVTKFGCMVNGNPSSRKKSSKVYRVRPRIEPGWEAEFQAWDLGGFLNKKILKEILEAGGKYVGIGDWRPVHGRFTVLSVQVV